MQALGSDLYQRSSILIMVALAALTIGTVHGQPPDLGLGDDDFEEVDFPVGFTFPFCNGTYTSVFVGSNGFVTFGVGSEDFSESVSDFLAQPPRIAPLWVDLSPNNGGQVTTELIAGNFVVTWDSVPEFGAVTTNTFALTLRPNGSFNFSYGAVSAVDALVGASPGLGDFTVDPGEIDLSFEAQPISGAPGEAAYELFVGDYDLAELSLEWDACPFVEFPRPALPGVCYGSTGGGGSHPGSLLTIDTGSGAATLLGSTLLNGVPGLAINSSGQVFGTERTTGVLYRIDALLGVEVLEFVTGLTYLDAIAFDENDVLYGVYYDLDTFSSFLVTLDLSLGTVATMVPIAAPIVGLAFDPTDCQPDCQLYGSEGGADGIYRIDKGTGALDWVGSTGGGGSTPDLLFDASGQLFATKGGGGGSGSGGGGGAPASNDLISVNKLTGAGTLVGQTGVGSVSGLACAGPAGDQDEDGVPDSEDLCPDTVIPEFVPTQELKANRWALADDNREFDTGISKSKGKGQDKKPARSFTTADTKGCSCDQIIGVLGLGGGHEKFGCNTDAMDQFIDLVNP